MEDDGCETDDRTTDGTTSMSASATTLTREEETLEEAYARAARARARATDADARGKARETEVRLAIALARQAMKGGEPWRGLIWLELAGKGAPREASVRVDAGRAHLMLGDIEGARLCFERAETLTRERGDEASVEAKRDVMRVRGEFLLAQGRFREAKEAFDELLAETTDISAVVNAAVTAVYNGELDKSLAMLEKSLLEAQPNDLTQNAVRNLHSIYELTARVPSEAKHVMGTLVKTVATSDVDVTNLGN